MEKCQTDMENPIHGPKMFPSKQQHRFVHHNEVLFMYQRFSFYKYIRQYQ